MSVTAITISASRMPALCSVRTREALPWTTWASSIASSSAQRSGLGSTMVTSLPSRIEAARGERADLSAPADEHAHRAGRLAQVAGRARQALTSAFS